MFFQKKLCFTDSRKDIMLGTYTFGVKYILINSWDTRI